MRAPRPKDSLPSSTETLLGWLARFLEGEIRGPKRPRCRPRRPWPAPTGRPPLPSRPPDNDSPICAWWCVTLSCRFFCHFSILLTPQPPQTEDDYVYEQDILRSPGSTKPWLAYINYKVQHGTPEEQAFVLERACVQLPRSYKLWKMVRFLASELPAP